MTEGFLRDVENLVLITRLTCYSLGKVKFYNLLLF
jgi:hypothetical protein